MIAASVGVGKGSDAHSAGRSACKQALNEMPGKKADALIVFGSTKFNQTKLIEGVASAAPETLLVGCSTSGEISSEGFATEQSVVVMALASDKLKFSAGRGGGVSANPAGAGVECGKVLRQGVMPASASSALVFLDIVSGDGDAAVQGLRNELGHNYPIWGGAAGDDLAFRRTFQYFDGKAETGAIVGLGL